MSSAVKACFPALLVRWCLSVVLVLSLVSSSHSLFYTDSNDLPRIGRRSGPSSYPSYSKADDSRLAELLARAVRGANRAGYLEEGDGGVGVDRRGGVEWRPEVASEGRVLGRRGGVEWRSSGAAASPGRRWDMRRDMPEEDNMADNMADDMADKDMADKVASWLSYRAEGVGGGRYRRHTTPHQHTTNTAEDKLNSEDGKLFDQLR